MVGDKIRLFALSHKTGEKEEITNLYWFMEKGVLNWFGQGYNDRYDFEIVVNDETVAMTANLIDDGGNSAQD